MKQCLHQKGFRYREGDVTRDVSAAREIVRMTGQQGVPVTLINNRPVVGFNQAEIDRLLSVR